MEASLPEVIPDSIEPVLGARFWRPSGNKILSGYMSEHSWKPGKVNEARCLSHYIIIKFTAQDGTDFILNIDSSPTGYSTMIHTWLHYNISIDFGGDKVKVTVYDTMFKKFVQADITDAREPHTSPLEGCHCGFYAKDTFKDLLASYSQADTLVLGVVAGWGKVIAGDSGWRAELAYPKCFFTDATIDLTPFGVPVYKWKENKKWILEQKDLKELIAEIGNRVSMGSGIL